LFVFISVDWYNACRDQVVMPTMKEIISHGQFRAFPHYIFGKYWLLAPNSLMDHVQWFFAPTPACVSL